MTSLTISALAASCIFGATLLGLLLRRCLPDHHLSEQTKDTVKLGVGMIATLAALVLGLLVNSAKNTYDAINAGFVQSGARLVQLDGILAQYGPAAADLRAQLRQVVSDSVLSLWPEESPGTPPVDPAKHLAHVVSLQASLHALTPESERQQILLAKAEELGTELSRTRWLLIEQSQGALPMPLLAVVIFWLSMLYLSFGLFAPRNATVLIILFLCALAVALALFVTLEMNRPLAGMIKVPSAPLRAVLQSLGN